MAKYYQRPDGLYETTRTINGKRIRFRGKTVREVDAKILEWKEEKELGRPFNIVAEEWFNYATKHITESSEYVYGIIKDKTIDFFGKQRIGEITRQDCNRFLHEKESMGFAKNTLGSYRTVLRLIFEYAMDCGDIATNPCAGIKLPKNLPQKEVTALTEEQEYIVETCRNGDYWLFGLMLLYTGMRKSELIALEYSDIDFENNCIHVTKKVNLTYSTPKLETHLKSKNGKRDIPLFSTLRDVIPRNRIGKVFPSTNGKYEYMNRGEVVKVFNRYLKDAGLPKDITAHQFRHSYMTLCYESGISTKDAAAFLGDTEAVATNVYAQLRESHHITAGQVVEEYLNERLNRRKAMNG